MRWFLVLVLSCRLFASSFNDVMPSSQEEILSLSSDLLIDGFVSVISGQVSISETDLHVKGAQDLTLKRTYIPPQTFGRYEDDDKLDRLILGNALLQLETKGWVVNPHLLAGYNLNSPYFLVRDPQGFVLQFLIQGSKGSLVGQPYGYSNLRAGEPNSSADLRNIELSIEGDWVKVIWPNGVQRHYLKICQGSYRLERELFSNGKATQYEYNDRGFFKISSTDSAGKYVYASISKTKDNHYIGSDGREVDFAYEKREIKGEYKKGRHRERLSYKFHVMTRASNPVYSNSIGYNERSELNSYDAKAYPVWFNYFQTKNILARVQTFSTPSGTTSFSYDPAVGGEKSGTTTVTHPDGAQTIYRFSKRLLLEAIENWYESKLINKKTFEYDHKQHLKRVETLDEKGTLLLAKCYECDIAGNPTLETSEGDFGIYSVRRKFDKNRLVFEDRDDGLQYEYTYLGDTWLVTSKTTYESGKKLRKTTYYFDDANNLFQEEEEDKTRTHYTFYQTAPHLHRVEWEEKLDWNNQLIRKIRYGYDKWGNTEEEQHFGSDGKLAYTIKRTYNEKGELLDETNPLDEKAIYKSDQRGRCYYEEPFSNGLVIQRTFDAKGRLKILKENNQETQFDYNSSDELIEKTDYLGYITKYHYDPVHGKPDRIEEPLAITQIIYDAFGREKERIDPFKVKTERRHNSYGDVSKITHPGKGIETFTYYPNRTLKNHTDPDGLITSYSYDALGRVKEKSVGDYTTVFHWDGYNLYEEIDAEGLITEYKHDLTGRKIEEKRDSRITSYGYDSLGFLSWEERSKQKIEYTNDCLGRVLKKTIDGVLETTWTYDKGGNISSIGKGGTSTFDYDPHNRLIEKIDPQGNKTVISYENGPQTLLKTITDPMKIVTKETYHPKGQLLSREVEGQVVQNLSYDKLFRISSQDHLTFGYTQNEMREWIKEAEERTTRWTYTLGDRIRTKQKPDGTILVYNYDTQWRLASEGTREFRYDKLDRLVGGTGFTRKLDAFGNIKREEWSNGLWIESDYDDWNRPLERRLSDQSRIKYDYEGPFLKKVTRFSQDNTEIYSHQYDCHDARGNPQTELSLFETTYLYDKSGRKASQDNPYFQETVDYDPSGNLRRKGNTTYTYDNLYQMTSESGRFTAKYDVHYNLENLNGELIEVDSLNQIQSLSYDLNGNVIKPGFTYDEFDQLIEAEGERYVYDALGRRLQKGSTSFLYIDDEEIGAFEKGQAKELKVPGFKAPIAIEIDKKPYIPIADVQGIIRILVDLETGSIAKQNDCDAFGVGLSCEIPYAYAGKRYDPKTKLIYFGKRYYDPSYRRWLTPDPIGPVDHSNLYQYVFNNPFYYQDPTGELVVGFAISLISWGAGVTFPTLAACAVPIAYGVAIGAAGYGGYKLIEALNERGWPTLGDYYFGDLTPLNWTTKNGSVDPTLPENPDDLLKKPGWKETTHPDAGKNGHRSFENTKTGEKLRYDQGKPGKPGHEGHGHYHRPNPKKTNPRNEYLDNNYKPTGRHSDASHLYPPESVWWN